ncbi:transcription termination factor Rho [Propionibacterium australiense]|uniref:Transcription termination factor Rho n=1 Tax=Propionibacterium australiense TaxID=119981 RepID=A0A383S2X9_9ACTN|nr:transcription termination factor Rho [Propionibacterium australiense]SYZ32388.1 ATPase, F1/V1/A1 complex, alpha/beta subunit, nucleotide-binding domain [Propionibacterium australiense]VEH90314.1 Transcription termination factor Rho [Propionibacterium australiense]
MTETQAVSAAAGGGSTTAALSAMKLSELKAVAAKLGIKGVGNMRKGDLIEVIGAHRPEAGEQQEAPRQSARRRNGAQSQQSSSRSSRETAEQASREAAEQAAGPGAPPSTTADEAALSTAAAVAARLEAAEQRSGDRRQRESAADSGEGRDKASRGTGNDTADEIGARLDRLSGKTGENESGRAAANGGEQRRNRDHNRRDDEESGGSRRSRRRRNRDRSNRRRGGMNELEDPVVREDDVLVDVSGILDVLDNYAFVRTSGYLPGPSDAYVSLSMVRKNGLRKGDVITGAIRQPREGERREKYNPLVRLDTVNGTTPENMRRRPEFAKLTPLYPQERLRMETTPTNMTGRIIDLMSPIGKGQRGLVVSPPKAGKTMVMQSIANAITVNNPEVHLMVVLVDERPEEVTDFQRTTTAEVIASTFDRPAEDHTTIAELAIERAKRLVELGRDVVILLDGITRLGRAYNLAAPASGRILSGGVDSAALYPPKKFFGAARNIENGGSLTILATALVETGSKMDEVIFEEFKGTGNMELRLSRQLADKRIFPAINVDASSTRREELLMSAQERDIIWKLRRVLSGLDEQKATETLLGRLRKTRNNSEFLVVISRTTPGGD